MENEKQNCQAENLQNVKKYILGTKLQESMG